MYKKKSSTSIDEVLGGKWFILELVFNTIDESTSLLGILSKRVVDKVKWFMEKALDLPLSLLIYSGATFIPLIFRVGSEKAVFIESLLGRSLRDLGAKSIDILSRPTQIIKYIASSSILDEDYMDKLYSLTWKIIEELNTRTRYLFSPLATLRHILSLMYSFPENSSLPILEQYLELEGKNKYIPIPLKTRIVNESIIGILSTLREKTLVQPTNKYITNLQTLIRKYIEVLAKTKYLLEENEQKITFIKFKLQDYDSLAKFIAHARNKGVGNHTVKAVILDKLYLKTTIPLTTVTFKLLELLEKYHIGKRITSEDFTKLRNILYKYKTVYNNSIKSIKDACKDGILDIDIEGIELVKNKSDKLYHYVMDSIKLHEDMITSHGQPASL